MKNYKQWNKVFFAGMAAMALAFGLVSLGCDTGTGGGGGGGGGVELIPFSGVTGEQVYTIDWTNNTFNEYTGNVASITATLIDPFGGEADKILAGSVGSITAGKLTLNLPATVPSDKLFSGGGFPAGYKWGHLELTPDISLTKITGNYRTTGISLTYIDKAGSGGGARWEAGWHYGMDISGFKWAMH